MLTVARCILVVVWNQVAGSAELPVGAEGQPSGRQDTLAVPRCLERIRGASASPRTRGMESSSTHNSVCSQVTHGEGTAAAATVPLETQGSHMAAHGADGGGRAGCPRTGSAARSVCAALCRRSRCGVIWAGRTAAASRAGLIGAGCTGSSAAACLRGRPGVAASAGVDAGADHGGKAGQAGWRVDG